MKTGPKARPRGCCPRASASPQPAVVHGCGEGQARLHVGDSGLGAFRAGVLRVFRGKKPPITPATAGKLAAFTPPSHLQIWFSGPAESQPHPRPAVLQGGQMRHGCHQDGRAAVQSIDSQDVMCAHDGQGCMRPGVGEAKDLEQLNAHEEANWRRPCGCV